MTAVVKRRRRPLTRAVLRGLRALVMLGAADLEGAEQDWLAPKGTFSDTSVRDVETAKAWLTSARAAKGMR